MKAYIFYIAVLTVSLIVAVNIAFVVGRNFTKGEPSIKTIVCGHYAAPTTVMGVPKNVEISGAGVYLLQFEDDFILTSKSSPSVFLHKLGVFYLEENKVTAYALVNEEDFHPCPK